MHTLHALPPLAKVPLAALAGARTPAVARLAEGHETRSRVRYLWNDGMPDDWAADDASALSCPPLELVAVPDVEVRSDWMPHRPDGVIGDFPIFPRFVRTFYEDGLIDYFKLPVARRRRTTRRAAYHVAHFNMRTYGHFLLEVLPKLLIVEQLYAMGHRHPVIFPAGEPHLQAIVRAACPSLELLLYDWRRESLVLPVALLPTLPMSDSAHLHDVVVASMRLLAFRFGRAEPAARRLFIVREGRPSYRVLDNEAELAGIAAAYGFEPIRPERLSWAEQVRAFASASHVVGEFTSALHNTLFCQPSAKVVCLNWMANVQSAIAAAAGHEIGYLFPEHGVRTTFTPGWKEPQRYTICPALFRARLEAIDLKPQ